MENTKEKQKAKYQLAIVCVCWKLCLKIDPLQVD